MHVGVVQLLFFLQKPEKTELTGNLQRLRVAVPPSRISAESP
jgi:hypothetical protein